MSKVKTQTGLGDISLDQSWVDGASSKLPEGAFIATVDQAKEEGWIVSGKVKRTNRAVKDKKGNKIPGQFEKGALYLSVCQPGQRPNSCFLSRKLALVTEEGDILKKDDICLVVYPAGTSFVNEAKETITFEEDTVRIGRSGGMTDLL